jgi:hypothetical protein
MNSFERNFEEWLEESLESDIPDNVKAFSFNLYEPAFQAGYEFGMELIGAEKFDLNDEDWACEEVWEPPQRGILIPISYSGETWEKCLDVMKQLAIKFLQSNKSAAKKLKSRQGVGIGFVDGNLEVIWQSKIE